MLILDLTEWVHDLISSLAASNPIPTTEKKHSIPCYAVENNEKSPDPD